MSNIIDKINQLYSEYETLRKKVLNSATAVKQYASEEVKIVEKDIALASKQTKAMQEKEIDNLYSATAGALDSVILKQNYLSSAPWTAAEWAEDYKPNNPATLFKVGTFIESHPNVTYLPNPATMSSVMAAQPAEAKRLLEILITRMLGTTPGVKIHILDPHNNGSTLRRFGKADTRKGHVFSTPAISNANVNDVLNTLSSRVFTVAQNFLQGDAATLEVYNETASVKEDIHVVFAIAPETYSLETLKALRKLARTGAASGVYITEILQTPIALLDNNHSRQVYREYENEEEIFKNSKAILGSFYPSLKLDEEPPSQLIDALISKAEHQSASVLTSVDLRNLMQTDWVRPGKTMSAVIGKSGARDFSLEIGISGAPPHTLIGGQTGSGKSTLLHSIICAFAAKYSPEDLNFYLLDGKQGVEMSNYAPLTSSPSYPKYLPHVKIAAVKSDIRMYMSVLERVKNDIKERGKICAKFGAEDLLQLEKNPDAPRLPRIIVLVDEFHVLLTDPVFGEKASFLLRDTVKQGRSYGIHYIFATQSLGNLGARGENSSFFSQLGNRIALACDDNVSEAILGDGNRAAAKLSRIGEAIFTANVASPELNVPVQIAYLEPPVRAQEVSAMYDLADEHNVVIRDPFIFAGDALPSVEKSPLFILPEKARRNLLRLEVGAPVSISKPVSTVLNNLPGGNLLVLGVGEDDASDIGGLLHASALSAFKYDPSAKFIIVSTHNDEDKEEQMLNLHNVLSNSGANVELVEPGRLLESKLLELESEIKADTENVTKTFLIVSDGDGTISNGKLNMILSKGPENNIHTMLCVSSRRSLNNVSGVIGDKAFNLFDSRIFATLNASESSPSVLGLPARIANESERFTLWSSTDPNNVHVFMPYATPVFDKVELTNDVFKVVK